MSNKPNVPTKNSELNAMEYVTMVFNGCSKREAFKEVFNDRYLTVKAKAEQMRRDVNKSLDYEISVYEKGQYVQKLYSVGSEQYFSRFIDKRTKLLDKMYDVAMDEEERMGNRLNATKIFLDSTAAPKTINHKVEVDVKDDFKQKLAEKQRQLHAIANNEDIIDLDDISEE